MKNLLLEACVETLSEAVNAEKNGANRLELCSHLDLDGLTPDLELTKQVLEKVNIPVKVMIRPRDGNFIYDDQEFLQMVNEIQLYKKLKVLGVVFGILDEKNHLNLKQIKLLGELAFPLEVTIHKAIDLCHDPVKEVENLKGISEVSSVLTSGKAATAIEGAETIRKMITVAAQSLTIIAAGKITNKNINGVHRLIKGQEYHGKKIVGLL